MEKYLVKTVNNTEADASGNVNINGSGSGLFPNGFEFISTSRDFQASDAGKLLFLENNVALTMPPLTPFSEHENVGIMAADSNVFFNMEPGGSLISFMSDDANGEVVLLTNEIIDENLYLLPISTNIIDDNGVRKTSIRYLYDKVQNAIPLTGTDDIEITDFNKGVILTSPNSSRYRITVDNAGTLITTLI